MPHDARGNELKVGDEVVFRGKVKSIQSTDEYCNCSVISEYFMYPTQNKTEFLSVNTRQLELVSPIPE